MPEPILNIRNLTAGYGATPIISDVNLCVELKGIVVIVGPNGAGKSTLLKSVFALNRYFSGAVEFMGRSIVGVKTADLVPMGISAVPQTSNVFANLTVSENLQVGTYASPPKNPAATLDMILTLFPDLREKLNQPAGQLSGGQRQMVAIGRAMMSDPKLLLLDEPTAGLSPAYLERIFRSDPANSGCGHFCAAGGAERKTGVAHCRYWVRAGQRQKWIHRYGQESSGE